MAQTVVKVKICGIRTLEEAKAAVDAGADYLGFNFWPGSSRFIGVEAASKIIDTLRPFDSSIGVFVNEPPGRIREAAQLAGLVAVQLHGDETPQFCAELEGISVIKALRICDRFDPAIIREFRVDSVLLDSRVKGSYGGTGQRFDWQMAIEAKRYAPIFLAGGITIENVEEAIVSVRPACIDVCSGVEAEPGRKDFLKVRAFLREAARVNKKLLETGEILS